MDRIRTSAAALLATGLLAGTVAPASADDGRRWPDGDYSVIMRDSVGAGDLATGSGGGSSSIRADGQFTLWIADGTTDGEPGDVFLLYSGEGSGVSSAGTRGSGTAEMLFTGAATAEGGYVGIDRERVDITFTVDGFRLPTQTSVVSDRIPLVAQSASCGLVEGTWVGTLEGIDEAALTAAGFSFSRIDGRFLAIDARMVGDPEEWIAEVDGIVQELTQLRRAHIRGRVLAGDIVDDIEDLVIEAEDLLGDFDASDCPPPEGFGLGITAPLRALMLELFDLGVLTPAELGRLAAIASRGGVMDAEVSAAVLDAVNDGIAEGGDPSDFFHYATAAAAAGDLDLARACAEIFLESL